MLKRLAVVAISLVLVLVAIAAIDGVGHTRAQSDVARPQNTGNRANDLFLTKSESFQLEYLAGVVAETIHEPCTGSRLLFAGMEAKVAVWDVECSSGAGYIVQIEDDEQGTMVVLECSVQKALTNLECFRRIDEQHVSPPSGPEMLAALQRLPPNVRKRAMGQFVRNLAVTANSTCTAGDHHGVCVNVEFCDGARVTGLCAGPADVQCCLVD